MKRCYLAVPALWWAVAGLLASLVATGARAEEYPDAPDEVLRAMKPGGISVAYKTLRIGPKGVPAAVHIYVVPAGRKTYDGSKPTTGPPITRDEISDQHGSPDVPSNIVPSPFYLEVYAPATEGPGASLQRVNSVRFTDTRPVNSIVLHYLEPKPQRGPMLLVGYSGFRSFSLRVFSFPGGLRAPAVVSEFLNGYGGTNYGTSIDFERLDRRGFTTVEESGYSPTGTDWVIRHLWNGQRFIAGPKSYTPKPYLVIGAMSKSRLKLEALRRRLGSSANDIGASKVLPTASFPRLRPGSYLLVMVRCPTAKAAAERVAFWNQAGYLRSANKSARRLKLWVRRGF